MRSEARVVGSHLDAAVLKARHGSRASPAVIVANGLGLGVKVGQGASVKLLLAELAAAQEVEALAVEGAVQDGEELERLRGQDTLVVAFDWACVDTEQMSALVKASADAPGISCFLLEH